MAIIEFWSIKYEDFALLQSWLVFKEAFEIIHNISGSFQRRYQRFIKWYNFGNYPPSIYQQVENILIHLLSREQSLGMISLSWIKVK